jgi:hypothetical protein
VYPICPVLRLDSGKAGGRGHDHSNRPVAKGTPYTTQYYSPIRNAGDTNRKSTHFRVSPLTVKRYLKLTSLRGSAKRTGQP